MATNKEKLQQELMLELKGAMREAREIMRKMEAIMKRIAEEDLVEAEIDSAEEGLSIAPVKKVSRNELEKQVTDAIQSFGVPANIKGYRYLRTAIILAYDNPELVNAVTKGLYPTIAELHSTTSSRVERAIRHAIEVSSYRGDPDYYYKVFGYSISSEKGKPTNSEFIALLADKFRLELQ